MNTIDGKIEGHYFRGANNRFEVVAKYIADIYGRKIKYVADVAGGVGMLTRVLRKRYNYEAELIDPQENTLVGVHVVMEPFSLDLVDSYDLIVGLHPHAATKSIAEAARLKPAILIPCCNQWDQNKVLGRDAIISEIAKFYEANGVEYERVVFDFDNSKNVGLVSIPKGYKFKSK